MFFYVICIIKQLKSKIVSSYNHLKISGTIQKKIVFLGFFLLINVTFISFIRLLDINY